MPFCRVARAPNAAILSVRSGRCLGQAIGCAVAWHARRVQPPSLSAREAGILAGEVLGAPVVRVEHVPVGFGNENWRVTEARGRRYVLKVGPVASAAKWASAGRACELAASRGVPVPRQVHFAKREDRVVRVFEWIEGRSAMDVADDRQRVVALFTSLGTAVAALHSLELDGFSSRLDGSALSFERWVDYVEYRLDQVRGRCFEHSAVDGPILDRACAVITELAEEVGDVVRPTLCHRDLYADNLLVDQHGALVAILDWDMAEAWDPAAEWFKLNYLLFPAFPGSEKIFNTAYHTIHPEPLRWAHRKALVDLMETLNTVANATAQGWNSDFETRSRARLEALLSQGQQQR
jgi:fructosamine-3-kinase